MWISTTLAARMIGYDPDAFRRKFCDPVSPVDGVAILVIQHPRRRTIKVLRSDIEALIAQQRRAS